MHDIVFEEIRAAFLDNFQNCNVQNLTTELSVEFQVETDADWFKKNIVYPEDDPDESPIHFVSSISPIGDKIEDSPFKYEFHFKVKDKDKLINMLKTRE